MNLLLLVLATSPFVSSQNVERTSHDDTTIDSCPELDAGPPGIEFGELYAKVETNSVLLVDVREPEELQEYGRIPTSVNLPLGQIDDIVKLSDREFEAEHGFAKPRPEDHNVVLSCKSGVRATEAWQQLQPYGYCSIRVYVGSYLDWKANGGPLV